MEIEIFERTGDFAENKDIAADIRDNVIQPCVVAGREVVLNFKGVELVTQSFAHALISEILRTHGERALDDMIFKSCDIAVRGIIETVIQYSLETIEG